MPGCQAPPPHAVLPALPGELSASSIFHGHGDGRGIRTAHAVKAWAFKTEEGFRRVYRVSYQR